MKTKKMLFVIVLAFHSLIANAQFIEDARRYSSQSLEGTARYVSMGGAFSALGGDISSITDNPAAAAVFIYPEISFSARALANNFQTEYLGQKGVELPPNTPIDINQAGFVFIMNSTNEEEDFTKISFAFNYKRKNNFKSKFNARGKNTSGLDNYFLYYAEGVKLKNLMLFPEETISEAYQDIGENLDYASQQAFLGYHGYFINPLEENDENSDYSSNSNIEGNSLGHSFFVTESGYQSQFNFTLSAQYKDFLYIGMSVNSYGIEFNRNDTLNENGYSSESPLISSQFENILSTVGEGFSMQLGGILKSDNFRLGFSYRTPIWYEFNDETSQYLKTDFKDDAPVIINPNVLNIYNYRLIVPSKVSLGLAYVFKKRGLISFQYGRTNYQKLRFDLKNDDLHLKEQNSIISNNLKPSNNIRLGGELRIEKISFRLGYYSEKSKKYNVLSFDGNDYNSLTGGIGLDFDGSNFSIGFANTVINRKFPIYSSSELNANSLNDPINLKNNQTQIVLTYSIKL